MSTDPLTESAPTLAPPPVRQKRSFHCVAKGCEVVYAPFWNVAGQSVNLCHDHYAQVKAGQS